jgi:hypothetical protein
VAARAASSLCSSAEDASDTLVVQGGEENLVMGLGSKVGVFRLAAAKDATSSPAVHGWLISS